jgi:outer membrane receptor protein involved in Fe transport
MGSTIMNLPARNRIKNLLGLFGLLVLVWAPTAHSGTTGKLSGRVLDQKKDPLPSANVIVSGTPLGAATDIDGYFTILNVPPGKYDVQFRLVGYRTFTTKGVQVSVNNTTKVDAVLEDESITTEAVVVTAQRPVVDVGLTSSVATVTDNDIKALPVQELQDIVNLQAGVVDGHFRGGREGEVQFQVNGVSVNNVFDNKSTVRIDRSLIQEVQIITGTFDAEYGQAMSGVVNTVLKSGSERFDWNAEALTGGFLYQSGGSRGLDFKLRPTTTQNYQVSLSGPTGLPQTFFLLSGRRYVFDDYLYGQRMFVPTDTSNFETNLPHGTGDGKEIAMSYSREWSGLAKVTNRSLPALEISLQALFNIIEGKGLGGSYNWRLNPDGTKTQKTKSIVWGLDVTHTVSPTTFYTISARQNYYNYTDWVYDNFYDPRYDAAGAPKSFNALYYSAVVQGVDFGRYQQRTNTYLLKAAVTSQVTRAHQLKLGGEMQLSRMEFGTAGTLAYQDTGGHQALVRYVDAPPAYPGIQRYWPLSAAAFVHDMVEWNDLTIRAGLRFEYFDGRSTVPRDPANPANSISGAPPSPPKSTTKKRTVAPRFGLSYPITTRSSIFFSYGHFYQLPNLGDMYANANYSRLSLLQAGASDYGVLGNPDVRPQKTVHYEFGYKNAVTDFLGLSVNLFYKDIRDLLGVEFVNTYTGAQYARLQNIDFGNVTGFTLSIDQRRIGIVSSTIDYTWQMAQGNSSSPQETASLAQAGLDARPRQVPFDWDQRHTLNLTVQLSQPEDYSISTIVRFASGQPYTPSIGSGFGSQIERNSGRKPEGLLIDMRLEKYFKIAGWNMSLFARVFNLLNATYFNGFVYANTGTPEYSLTPSADRNSLVDPTRFFAPRRIEIGVSMNSSL